MTNKRYFAYLFMLATLIFMVIVPVSAQVETDTITVQPNPINDYLTNPGIGWQHFPIMGEPLLPETVIYSQRQLISWQFLNPAPGVYDWSKIDELIDEAVAGGKQTSLRVYTMRGYTTGHHMPEWVVDMGVVLVEENQPFYRDCIYQDAWDDFVNELRLRYDGNPHIAFIDISGYGNYNEWSWHEQTEWDDDPLNPTTLDGLARKRLADMYIGGASTQHKCTNADGTTQTVSYDYPGFQQTQLIMPYAGIQQSTTYVLNRRSDVGFRFDCLGNQDFTDTLVDRLGEDIADVWREAPVIFEFCGVTTEPEYMESSEKLMQLTHATLVHDNLLEPRSAEAIEDLMRFAGYRYQLSQITYPARFVQGESAVVTMNWQNVGYAPAYPRMWQNFKLQVGLTDVNGNTVLRWNSPADVMGWLPAETFPGQAPDNEITMELGVPDALSSGTYTLVVGIIDERTGEMLNLAIEGRNDSGWYTIGTLDVVGP